MLYKTMNEIVCKELPSNIASFDWISLVNNETLIGVLIGGILAILGAFWASKKGFRRDRELSRVVDIYIPLYDDLMKSSGGERLFKSLWAYEGYYSELAGRTFQKRVPNYAAEWDRIKIDARILRTPKDVRETMESLYMTVETYVEKHKCYLKEMQSHISAFVSEKTGAEITKAASGELLLKFSHNGDNENLDRILFGHSNSTIMDEAKEQVRTLVIGEIKGIQSYRELEQLWENWSRQEEVAINCLKKRIERFERKFKS